MDFCTGKIKNSIFQSFIRNSNADGLDISGTKIIIEKSYFKGAADKGISVGEQSAGLFVSNKIYDNNIGVAVKDSSKIILLKNYFNGNVEAISCYQKKSIFNGAYAYLANNIIDSRFFNYDKLSAIFDILSYKGLYALSLDDLKQPEADIIKKMEHLFNEQITSFKRIRKN